MPVYRCICGEYVGEWKLKRKELVKLLREAFNEKMEYIDIQLKCPRCKTIAHEFHKILITGDDIHFGLMLRSINNPSWY